MRAARAPVPGLLLWLGDPTYPAAHPPGSHTELPTPFSPRPPRRRLVVLASHLQPSQLPPRLVQQQHPALQQPAQPTTEQLRQLSTASASAMPPSAPRDLSRLEKVLNARDLAEAFPAIKPGEGVQSNLSVPARPHPRAVSASWASCSWVCVPVPLHPPVQRGC